MAFRGRGRGRGGYSYGGNNYARQEPVLLYPETLPLPLPPSSISQDKDLAFLTRSNISFQNFFESSPYYLTPQQSILPKSHETSEIERYSDRFKPKTPAKSFLSDYIKLDARNFPRELIQGGGRKRGGFDQKKVDWNHDTKLRKLDIFEKLEEKFGDRDEEEKKEGEEEEDEVDNVEDEEEESENDDYGHMLHDFQDDEDEFNPGGYSDEEEATFEL